MKHWPHTLTTLALFTLTPTLVLAQQKVEQAITAPAEKDTSEHKTPGEFSIGLGLFDSPHKSGSDRSLAFGHSGGTIRIIPQLATRWGTGAILGATLRLDAQDGLYELGIPAKIEAGLRREGWVDLEFEIGLGADHLGAAMLIGRSDEVALTRQTTQHGHLGLSRGRLSMGISGGHKRYTSHVTEVLEIDRQWTFTQAYILLGIHQRLGLELTSQAQWWHGTSPGDLMQSGDRSLTHGAALNLGVSEEVTFQVTGGVRQDIQQGPHRGFGGVQFTWTPTFNKERAARHAAPSASQDENTEVTD